MKYIDSVLNRITMYKLVLYGLLFLLGVAAILGFLNILSYNPVYIAFGTFFITVLAVILNKIFAKVFNAPINSESVYINSFILALLITPPRAFTDSVFLQLAFWATFWTIASKFLFTINKKHIFNPVAIGLVITALVLNMSATWWIGTATMLPFVLLVGFLVVRKTQQTWLVVSYLVTAILMIVGYHYNGPVSIFIFLRKIALDTPIFFFSTIMLTEPLTVPPTRFLKICYGIFVGFLFAPFIYIGPFHTIPELALVIGNIFSYIVSPKYKLLLKLKEKIRLSDDIYDFVFSHENKINFKPGQYLEWTLDRGEADSRGNRRYFTISSSPTEENIAIGVKFYPESSSFKKQLLDMKINDVIVASQLAGDFTLPKNKKEKLVFIAGGIGITPFRSMLKYLTDIGEKRDIIMFYSNKEFKDIAYKSVFDEADAQLDIKTIYIITDKNSPQYTGHITTEMIKNAVPDYNERYFYISGPHSMTTAFTETLKNIGVKNSHIKTDFFPGFA